MARWMQYWSSCHANIRHQVINTAGTLNSHTTHQVSTHRCSVNSGNAHCRFPATAKAEAIFNLLIGGRGIVIPSHDMSPVCQCGGWRRPVPGCQGPVSWTRISASLLSPVSSQPEPEPEQRQQRQWRPDSWRGATLHHHHTTLTLAQELKSSSSSRGSLEDQVEFN